MPMANPKNSGLTGMGSMDMGLGDKTQLQLEDDAKKKKKGILGDQLSSSGMMMLLGNAIADPSGKQ